MIIIRSWNICFNIYSVLPCNRGHCTTNANNARLQGNPEGNPEIPRKEHTSSFPFHPNDFSEFRDINCWERGRFSMFQGYENSLTEGSCLQVCTSSNYPLGGDQTMQMHGEFGGAHRYKLFKIECQDQGMLAYRHFPTPPLPARLAFKKLLNHSQFFPKKRSGEGKLLYMSSWYWEWH